MKKFYFVSPPLLFYVAFFIKKIPNRAIPFYVFFPVRPPILALE